MNITFSYMNVYRFAAVILFIAWLYVGISWTLLLVAAMYCMFRQWGREDQKKRYDASVRSKLMSNSKNTQTQ